MNVILVSQRLAELAAFDHAFDKKQGVAFDCVTTSAEALEIARQTPPDLMIIDQAISDQTGLALVREIISINAFIHIAMISDLSSSQFHHDSEGLGILAQIASNAESSEVLGLVDRLMKSST